jgi:hypothetical protein
MRKKKDGKRPRKNVEARAKLRWKTGKCIRTEARIFPCVWLGVCLTTHNMEPTRSGIIVDMAVARLKPKKLHR